MYIARYNQKLTFESGMKTRYKCVPKFFISSVFTSDSLCPKIQYFGLLSYINAQLKQRILAVHSIKLE